MELKVFIFRYFFLGLGLTLLTSNDTGILNTCARLWLMESEQVTPVDLINDVVVGSRVRRIPEEGLRKYRPKLCGNNNKDEGNSPKMIIIIQLRLKHLDLLWRPDEYTSPRKLLKYE